MAAGGSPATVDARDLNAPSLAVGDLVGPTTVTRRITNVSTRRESYSVRKRGLPDVDVQAFPATVRLAPGQSRTVRLRVTARPIGDRRPGRHRLAGLARRPAPGADPGLRAPHPRRGAPAGRRRPGPQRHPVVVRGRSGNGRTVKLHSTGLVAARPGPRSR